ncbi:hypothetical protein J6590_060527 [Homalodisca vitripennis]|nr:hypothetical protein J6590_060527 [Homalodisca vitripennis]
MGMGALQCRWCFLWYDARNQPLRVLGSALWIQRSDSALLRSTSGTSGFGADSTEVGPQGTGVEAQSSMVYPFLAEPFGKSSRVLRSLLHDLTARLRLRRLCRPWLHVPHKRRVRRLPLVNFGLRSHQSEVRKWFPLMGNTWSMQRTPFLRRRSSRHASSYVETEEPKHGSPNGMISLESSLDLFDTFQLVWKISMERLQRERCEKETGPITIYGGSSLYHGR